MRREMLEALKALSVGSIKKSKMNIEVYLANPVGIGEHPDVLGAIQDQIEIWRSFKTRRHFSVGLLWRQRRARHGSGDAGHTCLHTSSDSDMQRRRGLLLREVARRRVLESGRTVWSIRGAIRTSRPIERLEK